LVDSYLQAGGIQPTDLLASLREAGGLWLLGGGGLIAMAATLLFLVMTWRGIRLVAGNGPFGWQAGGVHADGI
jgi:hypothetical protein